jgi:hypothetical protein
MLDSLPCTQPHLLSLLSCTSSTQILILQRVYSNCLPLLRSLTDCQRLSSVASTSSNLALGLHFGERFDRTTPICQDYLIFDIRLSLYND